MAYWWAACPIYSLLITKRRPSPRPSKSALKSRKPVKSGSVKPVRHLQASLTPTSKSPTDVFIIVATSLLSPGGGGFDRRSHEEGNVGIGEYRISSWPDRPERRAACFGAAC